MLKKGKDHLRSIEVDREQRPTELFGQHSVRFVTSPSSPKSRGGTQVCLVDGIGTASRIKVCLCVGCVRPVNLTRVAIMRDDGALRKQNNWSPEWPRDILTFEMQAENPTLAKVSTIYTQF